MFRLLGTTFCFFISTYLKHFLIQGKFLCQEVFDTFRKHECNNVMLNLSTLENVKNSIFKWNPYSK